MKVFDILGYILDLILICLPVAVIFLVMAYLDLRQKHNRMVSEYELRISMLREQIQNMKDQESKEQIERIERFREQRERLQQERNTAVNEIISRYEENIDRMVQERLETALYNKSIKTKKIKAVAVVSHEDAKENVSEG